MVYKTIQDILKENKVKSYKETSEGLIAIRKGGYWIYFQYNTLKNGYISSGSTLHFQYH
jgi:hypothetical protein